MNYKIIVNIFYPPTDQLKNIINKNKDIYIPINGGSGLRDDQWAKQNLLFDDIGDNISDKNKLLNEMTSIYWVWKHYNELGNFYYIGFNHYRRFFNIDDLQDFNNYDIIVSKPIFSSNEYSLAWQYKYYHIIDDLQICSNVLRSIDKEFGDEFVKYMNHTGTNYAPCNMFVMKRDLFFEWCEFIFPILFTLEKNIDISNRDNYQKRALCFLTERIFNFWYFKKKSSNLKTKEINIVEMLDFKPQKINERGDFS